MQAPTQEPPIPRLALDEMVYTLLGSDFEVLSATERGEHFTVLSASEDLFGAVQRTLFVGFRGSVGPGALAGFARTARNQGARLVVVTPEGTDGVGDEYTVLSDVEFYRRLGGRLDTYLALQPGFEERMVALARNELPTGWAGKAEDHFEDHVFAALRFLFAQRVVQYGKEHRGKRIPDGGSFGRPFRVLYDCKAYARGFGIDPNAMRQIIDYVNQFHANYEARAGLLDAYLLVSSSFNVEDLLERNAELQAETRVPLATVTAEGLAAMIRTMKENLDYRSLVDWRRMLKRPELKPDLLTRQIADLRSQSVVLPGGG